MLVVLRSTVLTLSSKDQFNDCGGGEDVTYLSPFWEETARK